MDNTPPTHAFHLPPFPQNLSTLPAVAQIRDLLTKAAGAVHAIKHHRIAINRILLRAHSILAALNDLIVSNASTASVSAAAAGVASSIHSHLDLLIDILTRFDSWLLKLADTNFMHTVVNKELILGKLMITNEELTMLSQDLALTVQIDSRLWNQEDQEDRKLDNEELDQTLQHLVDNDYKILNALELKQVEYLEAMEALQKNITQHVDNALEKNLDRIFLDRALACLQRATAVTNPHFIAPQSPPEWVLTSWEIELGPVINVGGFGEVLKGTWLGHTPVAVKRLHMRLETAKLEKDFMREVKTWFPLRHPNILPLLGACATAPRPFMVAPFMSHGHSLQYLDWCERSFGPQCVEERGLKVLFEVSLGVQYLHARGVMHGDIKAVNILVDEHGTACVADFGFSSLKQYATSRMTTANGAASANFGGTLRWMSPERLQGAKLTPPVDVYAYGMTCYEILSEGEVPLTDTPDGLIYQHVVHSNIRPELPEPSASTMYSKISRALFALMEQCWSPNPMARPSFSAISLHLKNMQQLVGPPSSAASSTTSLDNLQRDQQAIVDSLQNTQLSEDTPLHPLNFTNSSNSSSSAASSKAQSSLNQSFQSAKDVLEPPSIQPSRAFSSSSTATTASTSIKTTTKILIAKSGTHEFPLLPNLQILGLGRGSLSITIITSHEAKTPHLSFELAGGSGGGKGMTPEGSRIIVEQDSSTVFLTVRFPALPEMLSSFLNRNLGAKVLITLPLEHCWENVRVATDDSVVLNWDDAIVGGGSGGGAGGGVQGDVSVRNVANVIQVVSKRSLDLKGVIRGYQDLKIEAVHTATVEAELYPKPYTATKHAILIPKGSLKCRVSGFHGVFSGSCKFGHFKIFGTKRWNVENGKHFDGIGSFSVLDEVGQAHEIFGQFEFMAGKVNSDVTFL
ncbi:UNVERIFIED_CONTAM: hypothetical protein HDU68_007694 [Siphonaria sp. JEL0065]|nr:hypothetical protein HDU68_007694 [Siphonaria sp. JEL0065]